MLAGQLDLFAPMSAPSRRAAERAESLAKLIADSADADGWARLSNKRISDSIGCAPTTARHALDRLRASGRIDFEYDREPVEAGGGIIGLKLRMRGARRQGGRRG